VDDGWYARHARRNRADEPRLRRVGVDNVELPGAEKIAQGKQRLQITCRAEFAAHGDSFDADAESPYVIDPWPRRAYCHDLMPGVLESFNLVQQ
jgi:hypothetical protein